VDGLRVCEDVAPAAWIAPRLGGGFGAVGRVVPRGYGAYARICHPAEDRDGEPVSWPAVAAACGRRAHALMQWHALVGSAETVHMAGSLWRGRDPQRGNLEPETLGELCGLLGAHTTTTSDCFFCVWEGCGWVENTWRPPSFMQAARERGLGFSAQELARPASSCLGATTCWRREHCGQLWRSPARAAAASRRTSSGRPIAPGARPPSSTSTRRSSAARAN